MDGGVKKALTYPLSDSDIKAILGSDTSILTYPDLENVETIDQIFDRYGRCVMLFPTMSANEGHWCAMLKKGREIEFFDPYGEAPEDQKDGMSRSKQEQLDMDQPYLTDLFRKSGYRIYYNTYPFQKGSPNIATCGRHCVVRLLYAPYDLDQYKKAVDKSKMSPDEFVLGVTADKLRK